ncbi:MAG: CHASE4 domain-containing protein, partial [bacterium]
MVIINYFDKNRTDLLFHDFALNKEHLFDTIVDIKRAPLLTFVDDYSFWDEMVQFIYTRDKHWAKNNFDASLAAYKTDAIWVYDPHWALVYSTSRDNMRINKKLPLPQSAYRDLFRDGPFCHFFINTAAGIMEIYGATIHPTADRERKTPAKGYFFVGKVWSDIFLKELTQFTNSTVILTPYRLALNDFEKSIPKKGIIAFSRILIGADGVPISIVNVRSESQLIKSFYRSRTWEIWFLFGFLIIFILVLMISLTRWISKPLSLISSSMKLQNPAIINTLQDDTSEFGHIARLITEFFMQKNALQES